MNALLESQLREFLGTTEGVPENLGALLTAISDAYDSFEAGRQLAHSSDIGSEEPATLDRKFRQQANEPKGTETELRRLVSLLTATLEATADGIVVVDDRRRITDYNQQFAAIWGISEAILTSRDDRQALAFVANQMEDPETFLARVQTLYNTPAAESLDIICLRDGRVIERHSKPQRIDEDIVGRVWSFRDITQRVANERKQDRLLAELERTNQELGKVNQELNDFAYVVSHDLKAPLRGIKALIGWIVSDYEDKLDNDGKEQLRLLLARVDRMHDLIGGILQYSRVARVKEKLVPVDLADLVPDIVDMLAPPENITITIQKDLPVIEGEPTKTTQVFQNLVSNAIKYMDKPQGWIDIGCTDEGRFWKFRIADNGPGIEAKHFDRIFQMFQTLSSRDEYESTGVGLTVVKKIVEMYGGRIWVESVPSEGSAFMFTMPKTQKGTADAQLQTGTAC